MPTGSSCKAYKSLIFRNRSSLLIKKLRKQSPCRIGGTLQNRMRVIPLKQQQWGKYNEIRSIHQRPAAGVFRSYGHSIITSQEGFSESKCTSSQDPVPAELRTMHGRH